MHGSGEWLARREVGGGCGLLDGLVIHDIVWAPLGATKHHLQKLFPIPHEERHVPSRQQGHRTQNKRVRQIF